MSRIDESRDFIPVRIAVLTVSDTRSAADDRSGDTLVERLTAAGHDFAYDVQLAAKGPLVLHGQNGYSVKSAAGQASHYYSQPFYQLSGTLTLPKGKVPVTGTDGSSDVVKLIEAGGVDRRGNRPSNVPNGTATLAGAYRFAGVPVSIAEVWGEDNGLNLLDGRP